GGADAAVWQIVEKRSHSPTHAWWFGNPTRGDYYGGYAAVSGTLTSPQIPVSGGALMDVEFWHWRYVHYYTSRAQDQTEVLVTFDGGQTYERLWYQDTTDPSQQAWEEVTIPKVAVPANATTMQVQFKFDSVNYYANTYEGWYIDDVRVVPSPLEFIVSEDPLAVDEGGNTPLGIQLSGPPSGDVTVDVTKVDGDPDLTLTGTTTLTFTPTNWMNPQYVTVEAAQDGDAEAGTATLRVSRTSGDAVPDRDVTAKERDDEGFTDDVEGGSNGWAIGGADAAVWQIVEKRSHSPTHAWWFGNPTRGDYYGGSVAVSGTLTSPEIPVDPGRVAILTFWHWRHVEAATGRRSSRDITEVLVTYDGATYSQLWRMDSRDASEKTWKQEEVRISVPAGARSLQVRFRFDALDGSLNTYEGWYIDDISVDSTEEPSASISKKGTAIRQFAAPSPFSGSTTFYVQAPLDIDGIAIQVFDLSGSLVWEQEEVGDSLMWDGRDVEGRLLANGPYLYILNYESDGVWRRFRPDKVWINRSDRLGRPSAARPTSERGRVVFRSLTADESWCRARIYNLAGQLVWSEQGRGRDLGEWSGVDTRGAAVARGTYVLVLEKYVGGSWIRLANPVPVVLE
ncbi:hypothetical protein ACFLTM_05260, partial [Candidatus Bipolaricaulota bacterium]